MKRRILLAAGCWIAAVVGGSFAVAVDLESFEFNDGPGTSLAAAANTANPGNQWVEDAQMFPSDVRNGSYNIVKESTALDNNYLQIANITSGTRFLVARISGWKLGATIDPANLEEVRFGFLNDDDADFGSTVTAQMMIRRNSDGTVALVGDALGAGSTNIPATAPLTATRSTPLTIALELNKSSSTYKVYYKDNTSPTQVLGLGTVATGRDGNSIRFSANNGFDEGNFDYPLVPAEEVFSVDRIALSDTNPFTDLIAFDIDRSTGAMTLRNTSGAALTGLESYSISSTKGAFDSTKWKTVTGNYDTGSGGNGTVDNAPWTVTSATRTLLSESFQSGDGGGLTNGQNVVLSVPAGGAWLKSPFEDVTMALNFTGGVTRTVSVNFVGNGGAAWALGDLNFDNAITAADYTILATNAETNLSGLTRVEAYRRGDLDGDGVNSIVDFVQFKAIYNAANGGAGAFEAMLAGVPEPSSILLFGTAVCFATFGRRKRRDLQRAESTAANDSTPHSHPNRVIAMPRLATMLSIVIMTIVVAISSTARAAILEDFTFNDVNDTLLEDAENVANSGNNWLAHANAVESSVQNGSYRINKQSQTSQASNALEIANITSGKAWLVTEIAGWSYTATASSPSERIRFAFMDNDPASTGGSTVTAEANIDRSGSGLALTGSALGTGSTNPLPSVFNLPLVRTTPFTIALELDKGVDQYSIYYKDNTNPFQLLGTGNLGASTLNSGARDGNSIRFAYTGTFGDTDEFVDINRIYLTNTSPLGGPVEPIALSLEVKSNGMVSIVNNTLQPISFDSYRLTSATNALNFGGWNTLSNQGIDAVGGGDDPGEKWTVSAGSNDGVLAESFLLGASVVDPDDILTLGNAFKVGGAQNLVFQYHDAVTGSLVIANVDYVTVAGVDGDYNNDGTVNAADYTVWRNNLNTNATLPNDPTPGTVTQADYTTWKTNFGQMAGGGSGASATAAVPEPATIWLLTLAATGCCARRRRAA